MASAKKSGRSTEAPKKRFGRLLADFVAELGPQIVTEGGEWAVKGFIDTDRRIYVVSSDTKLISKILEIHLLPHLFYFAKIHHYEMVLADHQNYYPDITFIENTGVKFALDFKTTYRLPNNPEYCNGFTLGSHGEYFIDRLSTKNIQFPYSEYSGHFCLGIIYNRQEEQDVERPEHYPVVEIDSIESAIRDLELFVVEKWRIASDKRGSGNTANIGSINYIGDMKTGKGMFHKLGEKWFDDYWMNYGKITSESGQPIRSLKDFVKYREGDLSKVVKKRPLSRKNESS